MEERTTPRRRLGLVAKLIALATSLTLAVLLLEVALRLTPNAEAPLLVKDAIVGQRYRAGFVGERFVPEAGRRIGLRFDRLGYRGIDRPVEKPSNVRRVAVLGDSFIAAVAVDEKSTMVAQLERLLNEAEVENRSPDVESTRWEALNFGVSGNGTGQSLLAWRRFVRRYDPDLVILCFYNGNDLADNHSRISTAHRPYFRLSEAGTLTQEPFSIRRATLSRWLSEHSRLYVWQKHKMRVLRDRLRVAAEIIPPGFQIFNAAPPAVFEESWATTAKLIETLAEEVRATGAEFLLVSIPAHEQVMDDHWRKLVDTVGPDARTFDPANPERRLDAVCGSRGIAFLPLVDAIRAGCAKQELHFVSEGHWNEAGNRLAAESIFDHLRRSIVAFR